MSDADAFASASIGGGYTGTVSLGEAITLAGAFDLTGGALAQADGTRTLSINGAFTWTGGTLNNTPSTATVNINGDGAITLPGAGNTLTIGSTLDFGSSGGEKLTTITGGGNLLLNGVRAEGIVVRADAKVQLTVDPNIKSWIRNDTAKTLRGYTEINQAATADFAVFDAGRESVGFVDNVSLRSNILT